jgi:hypothetical protein
MTSLIAANIKIENKKPPIIVYEGDFTALPLQFSKTQPKNMPQAALLESFAAITGGTVSLY